MSGSPAGRLRRWREGLSSRGAPIRTSQEGLDERGEAPPPYIKEPERAQLDTRRNEQLELRRWDENPRGRPPDYEESIGRTQR